MIKHGNRKSQFAIGEAATVRFVGIFYSLKVALPMPGTRTTAGLGAANQQHSEAGGVQTLGSAAGAGGQDGGSQLRLVSTRYGWPVHSG